MLNLRGKSPHTGLSRPGVLGRTRPVREHVCVCVNHRKVYYDLKINVKATKKMEEKDIENREAWKSRVTKNRGTT